MGEDALSAGQRSWEPPRRSPAVHDGLREPGALMAWDQDAMDTVALVALAPSVLATLLSIVLRTRGESTSLATIGLILVAYPYNARWTLAYLLAAVVLAAGGAAFLRDVLLGSSPRPLRRDDEKPRPGPKHRQGSRG